MAWASDKGKWRVAFRALGMHHFVGYFSDEEEAARVYDAAVLAAVGEFARLNFPARLGTRRGFLGENLGKTLPLGCQRVYNAAEEINRFISLYFGNLQHIRDAFPM